MPNHVHYDVSAFEREMRANFAAAAKTVRNEFERLQTMGNEVVIQFGVFGAKMDNEGVSDNDQFHAQASVIASLIENLASDLDSEDGEAVKKILMLVASYALRGGEHVATTFAPVVPGGRA